MPPAKSPKKKAKPSTPRDSSNWIKPVAFRLDAETMRQIDRTAAALSAAHGIRFSRTDAIRKIFADRPENREGK